MQNMPADSNRKTGNANGAIDTLKKALDKACKKHTISLVALSGGLDSTIISWHAKRQGRPKGIAVIASDFVSPDLTYCQMAAKEIGMRLRIANVKTDQILDGTAETVKILKNYNEIEIRNNIVMYMAIKWAAENGYDSIATGDGADELFAGYRFLVNTPEENLAAELKRMRSTMHFPSHKIGRALGVSVISPFLDEDVIEVAKEMDTSLMVRTDSPDARSNTPAGRNGNEVRYGKWILRKAFEDLIPRKIAWRPKVAMQDGAGTAGLTGLFESMARMDEEEYVKKLLVIKKRDGIIIRNRESMYYYEIFRREFGIPSAIQSAGVPHMTRDDKVHGKEHCKTGDGSGYNRTCPYCMCVIENDARFCRMCAAFPV